MKKRNIQIQTNLQIEMCIKTNAVVEIFVDNKRSYRGIISGYTPNSIRVLDGLFFWNNIKIHLCSNYFEVISSPV